MRKKLLRSAVLIPLVLMIGALSGPAFATPLIGASAKAYGLKLDLLGANLIPETPTFSVSGINQGADNLARGIVAACDEVPPRAVGCSRRSPRHVSRPAEA